MKVLTNNKYYSDIADTIRQMKGVTTTYKPREMASALRDMYSTEVESAPPLTFPSNGNNLLNYRIDGASGGVGDRTSNLFDEIYPDIKDTTVTYLPILVGNGTYTLSTNMPGSGTGGAATNLFAFANIADSGANSRTNGVKDGTPRTITSTDGYITIGYRTMTNIDPRNYYVMLNSGSSTLSYEPYGYKIPVVCGGTTTNIYIEEPIGEDESISMEEANVNIPTINGTNTFSVDTTVQPSTVYVQAPKTNNYNL